MSDDESEDRKDENVNNIGKREQLSGSESGDAKKEQLSESDSGDAKKEQLSESDSGDAKKEQLSGSDLEDAKKEGESSDSSDSDDSDSPANLNKKKQYMIFSEEDEEDLDNYECGQTSGTDKDRLEPDDRFFREIHIC